MLHVRQITSGDFSFIQKLASEEKTFTVPSDYVLWMLSRLYPESCLVILGSEEAQVGYLLGLINDADKTLFIWQLVVKYGGEEEASTQLLKHVKEVTVRKGLNKISFTMQPRTAKLWGYRTAKQIFGGCPVQCGGGINGEPEYVIHIS